MRPPGKYDELRDAQKEALAARESAADGPTRPTNHPQAHAQYTVEGYPNARPVLPVEIRQNAAEIARDAKEREEAAARAKEQDKGQGR